jgi:hypothetical protein
MAAEYIQGAELEEYLVTWTDPDGSLYDFSTGFDFTLKVGRPGETAAFTKTTGITGAATDPNVTVAWAIVGELNLLEPGTYTLQIAARQDSDDRDLLMQDDSFVIKAAVL